MKFFERFSPQRGPENKPGLSERLSEKFEDFVRSSGDKLERVTEVLTGEDPEKLRAILDSLGRESLKIITIVSVFAGGLMVEYQIKKKQFEASLPESQLQAEFKQYLEGDSLAKVVAAEVGEDNVMTIFLEQKLDSLEHVQPQGTEINLDSLPLTKQELKEVLNTLPESFTDNINSITASPSTHNITDYDLPNDVAAAWIIRPARGIHIWEGSEYSKAEIIDHDLYHEIGHLNDWESNKHLNFQQRITLLKKVTDRLNGYDDLYPTNYVESIFDVDSKKNLYDKANEYYGEIVQAYFRDDPQLPAADREIVEWVIKVTDPDYDNAAKDSARRAIMTQLRNNEKSPE